MKMKHLHRSTCGRERKLDADEEGDSDQGKIIPSGIDGNRFKTISKISIVINSRHE